MATTPGTSGAGGVLYRLDGQLRVAAFVELALARPRRDEAPGASDAATAPVAVGESYLSRVGCVRPGFLVRSIDDLRRGEATSMPHFHRWSAAPPVAMSPARCVARGSTAATTRWSSSCPSAEPRRRPSPGRR